MLLVGDCVFIMVVLGVFVVFWVCVRIFVWGLICGCFGLWCFAGCITSVAGGLGVVGCSLRLVWAA